MSPGRGLRSSSAGQRVVRIQDRRRAPGAATASVPPGSSPRRALRALPGGSRACAASSEGAPRQQALGQEEPHVPRRPTEHGHEPDPCEPASSRHRWRALAVVAALRIAQVRCRPQSPDRELAHPQPSTTIQTRPLTDERHRCLGKLQLLSGRLTAPHGIEKPRQLPRTICAPSAEREMSQPLHPTGSTQNRGPRHLDTRPSIKEKAVAPS